MSNGIPSDIEAELLPLMETIYQAILNDPDQSDIVEMLMAMPQRSRNTLLRALAVAEILYARRRNA